MKKKHQNKFKESNAQVLLPEKKRAEILLPKLTGFSIKYIFILIRKFIKRPHGQQKLA